ncbi:MAG: hypothetical protein HQ541_01365, partial [Mariniphaga sp.]|nr:hypothetical protein [Mariniphaga sp.]
VISDSNYGYFDFSQENSYGIYLNLNYTTSGFGLSLEYKDYHNFFIGSGLSDPSTLVKEHSYRLLNRSTHVTELYDESGVQAEIFIRPSDKNLITLNYSQALNQFGQDIIFKEFFAELNSEINKSSNLEIFGDYSSDELTLEKHRFASGVNYSHLVNKQKWLLTTEFEFQHVRRNTDFQKSYSNIYGGLIISNSTKFSAVLIWEFTNDKIKADLANTDKIESKRHFPGVNILYKPTSKHTFQLFAGERRGGPACTSGICYEILDFKGIELRITTRL